ncbi:MAG: inositol monophosphatase [Candidatus Wildermuthbacteria bacterium]|nr:inositol monophosphatase [Candidatus Wildermuthbacteria bacterium]
MDDFTKELAVAKDIARRAGAIMLQYFRVDNGEEQKADGSPVTIADKTINRMVIEELEKNFADVVIGEEESTGGYGAGRRWICDPIDGTKAYVWGVPTAMFSLGLAVDGVPTLGVAYDPFLDTMYEAIRGNGSYCNGKPIRVSQKKLSEGYVAITSSPEKTIRHAACVNYLIEHGARLAVFSGSVYKMCLVARGSFLGYLEEGLNGHDTAAAHVIVEEAGGMVTRFDGGTLSYLKPFKAAIFSNGVVHNALVESAKELRKLEV